MGKRKEKGRKEGGREGRKEIDKIKPTIKIDILWV